MSQTVGFFKTLIIVGCFITFGCANTKGRAVSVPNSLSLTGEWIVVDQTVPSLNISPNCRLIKKGTSFHFSSSDLKVYTDASKNPCDVFNYKTSKNTISFIKTDILWLCTYELKENELRLFSDNFFSPVESISPEPNNAKPSTTRIVVTLKKTSKTN